MQYPIGFALCMKAVQSELALEALWPKALNGEPVWPVLSFEALRWTKSLHEMGHFNREVTLSHAVC